MIQIRSLEYFTYTANWRSSDCTILHYQLWSDSFRPDVLSSPGWDCVLVVCWVVNVNGEHKYNLHNYFSPHTGSRWARPGQVTMHSVKLRGSRFLIQQWCTAWNSSSYFTKTQWHSINLINVYHLVYHSALWAGHSLNTEHPCKYTQHNICLIVYVILCLVDLWQATGYRLEVDRRLLKSWINGPLSNIAVCQS